MSPTPEPASTPPVTLADIVAAGRRSRSRLFAWLALAVLTLIGVGGYLLSRSAGESAAPRYQTEAAARGDLTVTVSATGNLQPTNKVDVGSELSGTIETVLVDDNDRVRKGQVLARLDVSKLNDAIIRSRANLASTEARVRQSEATEVESLANLQRLREVARLSGGKVPSKAELETAEAALLRSQADTAAARAAVSEARASLSSDETNLAKASIRSPINGVVLARKVEPGQTVAASLQAPVLFTLAEDLAKMELQVDVDEADVGQVSPGLAARFNVDAWPGRKYPARITRVGFGSQTKDGVVSYLTVLSVDNGDLSLRPGMTATAEIVAATRRDVLLIPNAALRFTPPAATAKSKTSMAFTLMPRPPASPKSAKPARNGQGEQRIWVLRDGQPTAVAVKVGVSDGKHSEVMGGELKAGMPVITEILAAKP